MPFDGLWGSPWVGFGNFQRMLGDPEFWDAVLNTLWIAVLQLVFSFPVPLSSPPSSGRPTAPLPSNVPGGTTPSASTPPPLWSPSRTPAAPCCWPPWSS
ncbi:hypothetical protein [Streptomyces sasae]|uniref:hypothetical protein n=1 Tax=Streptomyces sasae TaxID=1266772 RepID=UPI0029311E97|nr:hypothetical protein [Streptomyces sasae]